MVGSMEAVVHGRGDTYGHEPAVVPMTITGLLTQQVFERIRKAFGLKHLAILHPAHDADDAVTRAGEYIGRHIHGSGGGFEFADETVVQAVEMRFAGFGQVQIGKTPPDGNGCIRTQGWRIWLNQPMKRVNAALGIRLVNKKFKSSLAPIF